jgi:serine/threonine protein kinase/Tol biopolymer transport system component
MPLSPRTRLGPYEIIDLIGVGGMGEVYRARDSRLDRIVAIKVLPQIAVLDPMLRQRFEQEARIVAGISHPHICAIFDVGREGSIEYLVMECLEGETLADRMAHGLLPLDLVMAYGAQIAAALAAAHRHGVVHCDLKPANIMLTRGGVKLLDFGIAQLRAERAGTSGLRLAAELPTAEAKPLREPVAGTLYYMAPEQLRGTTVDGRSDIFALGAVLYQMVSGRRPFEGDTEASLIAAVLDAAPLPLESVPARPVPVQLEHLIRTCLAKDPDERWQSAQDIQRELAFIATGRATAGVVRRGRKLWQHWPQWVILISAIAASLVVLWVTQSRWPATAPPPGPRVRFDLHPAPPATLPINQIEARVSPNGSQIAFIARHRGTTALWVRPFDAAAAREIAGTDGASQPFWSPDSRSIGFYAQGALKRVSLEGGVVQVLCLLPTMAGATWSRRGVIVFSQLTRLARVPDYGGAPVLLPAVPGQQAEAAPVWPQFLPDGDRYLFRLVRGPQSGQGVYVGSVDTQTVTRVLDSTANVVPAARHLLFVRSGSLMAQPFDFSRLRVSGEPVAVIDQVMENMGELAGPSFSVSGNGVLAYRARHLFPTTLTWFDRSGLPLETLSTPAGCRNPEISPVGRRVAVECPDVAANTRDLWVLDAKSGRPARLTNDTADDSDPIWSPDDMWVVFSSGRDGGRDLYRRLSTGAGHDERLFRTPRTKYPNSWSRDGEFILFTSREEKTGWDIWLLPLGSGEPVPLVSTPAVEIEPQLSPDGRWLAYSSDESGRMEVFVRPFRAAGGAWLISTGGGSDPRWRDDGTELYYLSPDRALMVVVTRTGAHFEASVPRMLFQTRTSGPLGLGVRFNYAVGPGGRRFLITADVPEAVPSPITVILNWGIE